MFINNLVDVIKTFDKSWKLAIPNVVMIELRGLCNNKEISMKVMEAIHFIELYNEQISFYTTKGTVITYKQTLYKEQLESFISIDQIILNTVKNISESNDVCLCSGDVNFRLLARSSEIFVVEGINELTL